MELYISILHHLRQQIDFSAHSRVIRVPEQFHEHHPANSLSEIVVQIIGI